MYVLKKWPVRHRIEGTDRLPSAPEKGSADASRKRECPRFSQWHGECEQNLVADESRLGRVSATLVSAI